MYQERKYRYAMNPSRFTVFETSYKDTDVWIAIDRASFCDKIVEAVDAFIRRERYELENYLIGDKECAIAFSPVSVRSSAPRTAQLMAEAAYKADVGPMAAVAGAFSDAIAQFLITTFGVREVIVENGGDCALQICESLQCSIFAGESPLSEALAVHLDVPGYYGVCTSSGTVGHSFSFGIADAVMIICADAVTADAYATGFANKVLCEDDVHGIIDTIAQKRDILSSVVICGETVGVCGQFPVYPCVKEVV